MAEINIVIKAANKAGAIFAKVREDAIKMATGISGRPVTINTTSINKNLQATGKEADKATKKLKDMAATPMDGLVASIGKVGKALAGLAVAGAIVGAINKVREWRDEWMAALEKVGKAEITFQRDIQNADKIDPGIANRKARMLALQGGATEQQVDRKEELAAKSAEADALQKSIDDQVRMSAALNLAKNDLTGFMGSLKTIGAKTEKELEEFASTFAKEGGEGPEIQKRMLDLVQNFESPEMSAEMGRVREAARVRAEAAARGFSTATPSLEKHESPEMSGETGRVREAARVPAEAAARGFGTATPSLEKHERAAQERVRDIGVAQRRLNAVQQEMKQIEEANAVEDDIAKVKKENAARQAQAAADFEQQMKLAADHDAGALEARRRLALTAKEFDREEAARQAEEAAKNRDKGRKKPGFIKDGMGGPRQAKETDDQRFARLEKQFGPKKIGDVVLRAQGKIGARDREFMDMMRGQKNAALALAAARAAAVQLQKLEMDAAQAQIDTFREMQAMNRNLMANLQAR